MATEKERAQQTDRTADLANAEEALAKAHSGAIETAQLIQQAQQVFAEVRSWRDANHFADKTRKLIRGAA